MAYMDKITDLKNYSGIDLNACKTEWDIEMALYSHGYRLDGWSRYRDGVPLGTVIVVPFEARNVPGIGNPIDCIVVQVHDDTDHHITYIYIKEKEIKS